MFNIGKIVRTSVNFKQQIPFTELSAKSADISRYLLEIFVTNWMIRPLFDTNGIFQVPLFFVFIPELLKRLGAYFTSLNEAGFNYEKIASSFCLRFSVFETHPRSYRVFPVSSRGTTNDFRFSSLAVSGCRAFEETRGRWI